VALQSLKDLGRLTYRRFLELFKHMVGLLGRVISPSQGLYLHRTTQHRKTRINIHALSGIRTHDPSNQPAKTHASDRKATVTGEWTCYLRKYMNNSVITNVSSYAQTSRPCQGLDAGAEGSAIAYSTGCSATQSSPSTSLANAPTTASI
jgi:hypothetical protein